MNVLILFDNKQSKTKQTQAKLLPDLIIFFSRCTCVYFHCSKLCPTGRYVMNDGGTTQHDEESDCLFCVAGKQFVSQIALCSLCIQGKYQDSNAAAPAICANCLTGRYALVGGGTTQHDEVADCLFCEAGKYFVSTIAICKICLPGTYQDSNAAAPAVCIDCPNGRYLTNESSRPNESPYNAANIASSAERYGALVSETTDAAGLVQPAAAWPQLKGEHDEVADCLHCPAGKEFRSKTSICTVCGAGRYQDTNIFTGSNIAGQVCTNCPIGRSLLDQGWGFKWGVTYVAQFSPALGGSYETEDGLTERIANDEHDQLEDCLYCDAGMYYDNRINSCKVCVHGKIQTSSTVTQLSSFPNGAECIDCPEGKENVYVRSSNAKGYHDGNADCTDCPAGYNSQAGYPNCIACPAGFWQDNTGRTPITNAQPCKSCPAGQYANGACTACKICPKGSFNEDVNQPACKHCAQGKYNDKSATLSSDHDSPDDCSLCPIGRYNDYNSLKKPTYTYSSDTKELTGNDIYSYKSDDTKAIPRTANHRSLFSMRGAINVKAAERRYKKTRNSGTRDYVNADKQGAGGFDFDDYSLQYICRSLNREFMYATIVAKNENLGGKAVELAGSGTGPAYVSIPGKSPWAIVAGSPMTGSGDLGTGDVTMWDVTCPQHETNYDIYSGDCTYSKRYDTSSSNSQRTNHLQYDIICGACKPGYTLITGATDLDILVGYCGPYFENVDDVDEDCHQCPSGWYQDTTGSNLCKECAVGFHRTDRGADDISDCVVCEKGKYNDQNKQKNCKACPNGRYGIGINFVEVNNCTLCIHGKYNEQTGMVTEEEACKDCSKGRVGNGEAVHNDGITAGESIGLPQPSNACKSCIKGRYMDETGGGQFLACSNVAATSSTQVTVTHTAFSRPLVVGESITGVGHTGNEAVSSSLASSATQTTVTHTAFSRTLVVGESVAITGHEGAPADLAMNQVYTVQAVTDATHTVLTGTGMTAATYNTGKIIISNAANLAANLAMNQEFVIQTVTDATHTVLSGAGMTAGTYNTGTFIVLSVTTCKNCPNGAYGDQYGVPSFDDGSCKNCPVGRFTIDMNPPGATRNDACKQCPSGWYANQVRQFVCKVCEPGKYHESVERTVCKLCPTGKYQALTTQTSSGVCKSCPIGRYGDEKALETYKQCKKCPTGGFGSFLGKTRPYPTSSGGDDGACGYCPAGSYSVETGCTESTKGTTIEPDESELRHTVTTQPMSLTAAHWMVDSINFIQGFAINQTNIRTWTTGTEEVYATGILTTAFTGSSVSEFSITSVMGQVFTATAPMVIATTNTTTITIPASGLVSVTSVTTQVTGVERSCTYSCRPCPKGTYSEDLAQTSLETCTHCARGKFNDMVGQIEVSVCKNCPRGRYGFKTGLKSGPYVMNEPADQICTGCIAGKYNELEGLTEHSACIDCPIGYWLNTKNDDSTAANILQSNCKYCLKGRYGDEEGTTFSSQHKDLNGNDLHIKYCKACPAGQFLNTIFSTSLADCKECEQGKFSTRTGATDISECTLCPAGFYGYKAGLQQGKNDIGVCTAEVGAHEVIAKSCTIDSECAVGTSCVTSTNLTKTENCKPCVTGKYLPNQGATQVSDCIFCPAGRYGDEVGAPNIDKICMGGSCQAHCKRCPIGFYLENEGQTDIALCISCLPGKYGHKEAADSSNECKDCGRGKYTDEVSTHINPVIQEDCKDCPNGRYGTDYGFDSLDDCIMCTKGRYLGSPGRTVESDCKFCPLGRYTNMYPATTNEACLGCPTGQFGKDGLALNIKCNIGGTTGANTGNCLLSYCQGCVAGYYTNEEGKAACNAASPGYYCIAGAGLQIACPSGWFGREGDPTGTDTNKIRSSCSMCSKGLYGTEIATPSVARCTQCSKGKYSDVPAIRSDNECKNCPSGRYGLDLGYTKISECEACRKGKYQDVAGSLECNMCPKGYFQNEEGSQLCVRCSPGRYIDLGGFADCLDCPSGQFGCTDCTDETFHPTPHDSVQDEICRRADISAKNDDRAPIFGPCSKHMVLCGGPTKTLAEEVTDCPDEEVLTPRLNFERRQTCALCPSGWYQGGKAQQTCVQCSLGQFTGCPGYTKCLECSKGQTTYELASIKCVSKQMTTMQPIIMDGSLQAELVYEDDAGSVGSKQYSEYSTCIDWYTPLSADTSLLPDETTFEEYFFQVSVENTFPEERMNRYGSDTNQTMVPVSTPYKTMYCTCGTSECDGTFTIQICSDRSGTSGCEKSEPIQEKSNKAKIRATLRKMANVADDISVVLNGPQACAPPENGTFTVTIGALWDSGPSPYQRKNPELQPRFLFTDSPSGTVIRTTNHACVTMWDPLYMTKTFLRVRGFVQDAAGTPSLISTLYSTAPSCGDLMYLCQRCYPPNGPGAWTVEKHFNPELRDWKCQACPNGGDCRGPKLWDEVYGKYGYMRLGMEDFEDRKVAFWPCFKQKACLGGKLDLQVGELPGTKYSFWVGPYRRSLDYWEKKGCGDSAKCKAHLGKYSIEKKKPNDMLFRPPVDCCSAVDPMMEDLKACQDDPANFQALSINEGSLFVNHLEYDTTQKDLLAVFKDFNPSSAKIATTLPSENVPAIAPLGWGTVYFSTAKDAKDAKEGVSHPTWNMTLGFDTQTRGCHVDLALVDDYEQCHVELGFKRQCNTTLSGKCRLCRSCAKGYWAQGVSNCLECPSKVMNAVLVVVAFVAVLGMLYAFLASALEDSGAEAGSTVIHFSQGMQKILLNHIQLISLASGFPLKWPDEVNEMFYWMGMFGSAGSYVFNPACQDVELVEGESMFFQKQLVILSLPFISAVMCALFWACSGLRNIIDPKKKRWKRRMKVHEKRRARAARKLQRQNDKKLRKVRKARAKADKKLEKKQGIANAANTTKVVPVGAIQDVKKIDPISLACDFYSKLPNEKKVEKFFDKLDREHMKSLSKSNLLPLIQSLLKSSRLTIEDENFIAIWYHLTQVCAAKAKRVKLPAMIKWWKTGESQSRANGTLNSKSIGSKSSGGNSKTSSGNNIDSGNNNIDSSNIDSSNIDSSTIDSSTSNSSRSTINSSSSPALEITKKTNEDVVPLQDEQDNETKLEIKYQSASGTEKRKKLVKKSASKRLIKGETNVARLARLQEEFKYLVYDPLLDHEAHVTEMKSNLIDNVLVFDFMVQPLLPLGIVWKATKEGHQKNTVAGRHCAEIKKIRRKSQAGHAGLQTGDVLASMNGREIVGLSFQDVKELFRYVIDIGETYHLTFFRKVHKFKSSVHSSVRDVAMSNKDDISTWDKFIATMVSVIYLLYPTVTRGTFTIVACQRVGSRMYLQMDLDIQCWEETHVFWVLHLFLPCFFCYVIGLPLLSYLILRRKKHDLVNRFTRFRYGVLYTGYTDECYYWEVIIATRKAAVVGVSVFLTGAGAQSQALCAMMIVIFALTGHLLWRPYVPVTEEHNTLFWSEFWGLQTAFATFWTGLFFFQTVAEDPVVQGCFTVEVLTVNFLYILMAMRWYMILKLMDLEDMVSTKKLQGFDEEDLYFANRTKACLRKFFPEWQVVRNLWARRAWQNTVKHQILQRRIVRVFDFKNQNHRHKGGKDERFNLGTTEKLHSNAAQMLGLVVHNKEEIRKEKANKEAPKEGFFARRFSRSKSLAPIKATQLNEHQDELDVHLAKESVVKKKAMNSALRGSIGAGQLKVQTKLKLGEQRKKRQMLKEEKESESTKTYTQKDFEATLRTLLLSFQNKIKSEYMLKALFRKIDTDKNDTLSKSQVLVLIKNLANNKSLTKESHEMTIVWNHLTKECGSVTEEVTLQQLLHWHGPFNADKKPAKMNLTRRKSMFKIQPNLVNDPQQMIKLIRDSFRAKIKSEYMLNQLFMKLDMDNNGMLEQKDVLILVKNLTNHPSLETTSPEFLVVWNHLTKECGKGIEPHSKNLTSNVTMKQLNVWHGPFE